MHKEISKTSSFYIILSFITRCCIRMKKVLIYFLILLFLAIPKLYSQNTDLPFKAVIALGPSIPVGKFTKTAPDSSTIQSAALPGPSLTFSFSYKFKHSHFGVELMGGWQQNDMNDSAIARSMGGNLPPGSHLGVWTDNWHIWKLLIGPMFKFPLTQKGKTSIECGVLGGILKTTIPGYESWSKYMTIHFRFLSGCGQSTSAYSFLLSGKCWN